MTPDRPKSKPMSGLQLRSRRVLVRARQQDIADVAGISRQRVAQLETLEVVPPAQVTRYLNAIESLANRV